MFNQCPESNWGFQHVWGNKEPPQLFYPKAEGEDSSQHLTDPYTIDHITFAILQYILLPFYGPGKYCMFPLNSCSSVEMFPWKWFWIHVVLHLIWEILENTPCFIQYLRTSGIDPVYQGDSIANFVGDIVLHAVGYVLAWISVEFVGWWSAPCLIVLLQIISNSLGAGLVIIIYRGIKDIRRSFFKS